MSTSDSLKRVAEERDELLKKLPWKKRLKERFMTGDSFISWNVSSGATHVQWVAGSAFVTWFKTVALPFITLKAPWVLKVVAAVGATVSKLWAALVSFAVGILAVFKELVIL